MNPYDPGTDVQLSRLSTEALIQDATVQRAVSRLSNEMLVSDEQISRVVSRISLEVLVPSKPRYHGWGLQN